MILLVNNGTKLAPPQFRNDVGDFISPRCHRCVGTTVTWAVDNDCFSGFNEQRYVSMLRRMADRLQARGWAGVPEFVTMPDAVGDHAETVRLWGIWHRHLATANFNRAFVLQDGSESEGWHGIPWDYIEALFIGGSTAFKLGTFAREMTDCARHMGKAVHMGRVNSVMRLNYARDIGCTSCDGSAMARWSSKTLIPMLSSLRQLTLF